MTWQPNRLPPGLAKVCAEPGCGVIITDGSKCETHATRKQRYSTTVWQDRRVRSIRLAKGRCAECGAVDDLVLHHRGTIDNPTAVVVMCRACHLKLHHREDNGGR
jgi:5-methylcytosine-specific restriction endonuclease McrA